MIGLVSPLPPQVGGVASVAEWLLAHHGEIGCTYETFDLWRPPEEEMGGRLRLRSILRQIALLARFVRWSRAAPRIVHYCVACTPTALIRDAVFVAILRLAGRTTIAHIHGADLGLVLGSRVRLLTLRLLARLAAERVAIAPTLAADLERAGISSGCILNPVRFEPDGSVTRPASPELRLLCVGTYGERKGCRELIQALAQARALGAEASLRFVGKEEYEGEEELLWAEAQAHGLEDAVTFAGTMPPDRLSSAYEDADVLCLPSHREGLPLVILEAMAFGLPVLATPVGGIPDVVVAGATGLLVPPGDVDALAQSIKRLASEPELRAAMGAAGRERIRKLAGAEALTGQWRSLYAAVNSSS